MKRFLAAIRIVVVIIIIIISGLLVRDAPAFSLGLFTLTALIIYFWAAELIGRSWALLPAFLFAFSPTIIAGTMEGNEIVVQTLALCASKNIPLTNAAAAVGRLVLEVTDQQCRSGHWLGAHILQR